MILILLGAIEGAELAIDIANVGIINIPIDDIGHDFRSVTTIAFCFGPMPSAVRQRPKFLERPPI